MGIYNSSGAFRVTENDTTGVGVYAADGSLRITVVDGLSFTGLYASDGSINVVTVTANDTPVGLYDPCGALRGVTWTNEYGRPPNGAIYMEGLSGTLETPVLTWDGVQADPSPGLSVTLDPIAASGDQIVVDFATDTGFTTNLAEYTDTLDAGEIAGGQVNLVMTDLTDGTWYARLKHTRASPAMTSDWSNTVTITVASSIAALYYLMEAA